MKGIVETDATGNCTESDVSPPIWLCNSTML